MHMPQIRVSAHSASCRAGREEERPAFVPRQYITFLPTRDG